MNFDHELKQRLIGALVVTILSAIFIPMLFDDPIEEEGQAVTTLALPSENQFVEEPAVKAPETSEQVLEIPKQPQVEVAALTAPTTPIAKNALRPDEMEDATPVVTLAPKLQPKPAVAPKPKVEKSAAYSETTNYGVKPPEDIDDEPPMKPKAEVKKGDKSEDALLKQIRAAKLLDDAPAAKTPAPVDVNVADVKKVLTPEQPKKAGRWFIQLASLTNKTKAETLQEGLKAQGLPVTLSQIQNDKGTFYRLRVGPELDGKRAAAMKKKMDEQGINSILVSE
jgi:DedD protein